MEDPSIRLTKNVSDAEMERRWKAVRKQMKARKIDYLVIQNQEEYQGGNLRWFSNLTARHQFPVTIIFPVDDEMTTIVCGSEAPAPNVPAPWQASGIKNRLGDVYFLPISETNTWDAELALKVLSEKKNATIGYVQRVSIPVTFHEHLAKNLPGATFVDASDWVDELKWVKSPEEIELIKGTAALQDAVMQELKNIIQPGKRELDVYAEAHCIASKLGCERGIVLVGSGPANTMFGPESPHYLNRVINVGDLVLVLIECNGPGGYYAEIARYYSVGVEPTQELLEVFEACKEAQDMMAKNLVPGASVNDIFAEYKSFITGKGYIASSRSVGHGQSQSLLDRPNIYARPVEPWTIKPNMNIALHPTAVYAPFVVGMCCDNYITDDNGAQRIHKFPREITVL